MAMDDVQAREAAARVRLLGEIGEPGPVYRYGAHPDQLWEEFGSPSGRVVVLVHGGFFRPTVDRAHARAMAGDLVARGWRVLLLEYRRVPGSPKLGVDDVVAAHAAVAQRVGSSPLWVGHSAGGALVCLLALAVPRVEAVALAPLLDVRRAAVEDLGAGATRAWLGLTDAPVDPLPVGVDPRPPLVGAGLAVGSSVRVVHGSHDGAVPLAHVRSVLEEMVAAGGKALPLTVIEGGHHFDVVDPLSPLWPSVVDCLAE